MSLTERVARLRRQSLEAVPELSPERALLMTEFYAALRDAPPAPVERALAFKHLMERKTICINAGELIVGERGPGPKQTPTYPELCCHSLEDLETLDRREKIPFKVSAETRAAFRDRIIPFWRGRSMRERIFARMTEAWKAAYECGMFTEFMEQRAPGHTVLDDKIYRKGMRGFKEDIAAGLAALEADGDPAAEEKRAELKAMDICADALVAFARRHAEKARELAAAEPDPVRRRELAELAAVCERVPAEAPRTFREALQHYWFVHLGVITELNPWDSFNPGRLDQHLYPFYARGLADGSLTEDAARELLQCFWIKFNNQPAPPKVGVTAAESGTYTDFALINTGGLTSAGDDGVNDLTYLILDVIEEMRLLQPSSCLQLSKKNPDRYLKRAARIIRTGFGQPSIFNADLVIQEMLRQGKSLEDARGGGTSGCVETGAFGKENYNLTGYFNLPKALELALHDGRDPRTGRAIGPATGDPEKFAAFDDLYAAFERQVAHFVDLKHAGNCVIEELFATRLPAPFLSLLIDDCIAAGKDYHAGGARYNTAYIMGVGLGSVTDALAAVDHHVFRERSCGMGALLEAMRADFVGHERLRGLLLNRTPKYGNDDDRADAIMRRVFETYFRAIDGRENTRGGKYHIDLLPTTCHVYFGSVMGAMPDGRKAGEPLSEGISPVQGADRHGPTAVFKSAAKLDHVRTGGTLLNQKLTPKLMDTEQGLDRFVQLVRSYFRMDGHHVQFNVVDAATLRAAQREPAKHRDLIVRVASYSDYFCDLSRALQDEIIARTAHQSY